MGDVEDYEETYDRDWRKVVELPDGSLNRDQVMRELHDYSEMMREVAIAYDNVAGISKPNTAAVHVIEAVEQRIGKTEDYAVNDLIGELEKCPDQSFASVSEVVALLRELSGVQPENVGGRC